MNFSNLIINSNPCLGALFPFRWRYLWMPIVDEFDTKIAASSTDWDSRARPRYMKLILMEANTNRAPEDITQIWHQTASWQVCWWAQTRLHVETQLLLYDILNFCPTKSSRILSGLENLLFYPLEAPRQRDRKSERQRSWLLRESEIWVALSWNKISKISLHRKDSPC